MNPLETAVTERLHDAAARIPVAVDPDAGAELDLGRVVAAGDRRRPGPRAALLSAAAVVAVVAVAAALAVRLAGDDGTVEAGTAAVGDDGRGGDSPSARAPVPVVGGAPHVVAPPEWFGEPHGTTRDGARRTGAWVSGAIGRTAGDDVVQPVEVTAFDGASALLADADPVTVDGRPFEWLEIGEWRALATPPDDATPRIMVSGRVDRATLVAVLDAVEVVDAGATADPAADPGPGAGFTFELGPLPEGYTELVAPRPLGPDPAYRRVLTSQEYGTTIDEMSDWTDPLLHMVGSGEDLTAVDVGGTTGWAADATDHPYGPLRSLTWSPAPGVVLAITTDDMDRTVDDLVDLALAATTIPTADWDTTYGDPLG